MMKRQRDWVYRGERPNQYATSVDLAEIVSLRLGKSSSPFCPFSGALTYHSFTTIFQQSSQDVEYQSCAVILLTWIRTRSISRTNRWKVETGAWRIRSSEFKARGARRPHGQSRSTNSDMMRGASSNKRGEERVASSLRIRWTRTGRSTTEPDRVK